MFPSADRKSFHISTTRSTPGQKGRSPGSIPPNRVWKPQPHWVMDDWIGPMGLARGERCPPGQRRGPDAHGEDNFPSPDQTFFGIFTIRATRGGKRRTPGSIPVHRVWTPQPHWVIADWIGRMALACGESFPPGQRPGPAATGEDTFPSPDQTFFGIFILRTTRGGKRRTSGSIPVHRLSLIHI